MSALSDREAITELFNAVEAFGDSSPLFADSEAGFFATHCHTTAPGTAASPALRVHANGKVYTLACIRIEDDA